MQRRDALKLLLAGGVLPAFTPDLFTFLQGAHPASGYTLRTLNEWATGSERENFLNGLADVDKQSNDLFAKDFAAASPAQQLTLLRAMDDASMSARRNRPTRHGNTVPEERDKQLEGDFWEVFKGITLHGYYTSEIGFTQELNLQIIPGAHHGCVPVPAGRKA